MLEILINLFALSIGAGFIGALSGLGGGVFIVPALVIFAHMPMKVAVGASLISVVATSAGASVAFVRDGWTNLKVAMVLECATVTGAVIGAYLAGVVPTVVLELLFAAMMLQSAYFTVTKRGDDILTKGDPLAERLELSGEVPDLSGNPVHYEVVKVPQGGALMVVAGLMSGTAWDRVGRAQGDGDGLHHAPAAQGFERDQQLHDWRHRRRRRAGVPRARRRCHHYRGPGGDRSHGRRADRQPRPAASQGRVSPDRFRDNSCADRGRDGMARVVGDLSDAETGRRSNTQGVDADSAAHDSDRRDDRPRCRTCPDLHLRPDYYVERYQAAQHGQLIGREKFGLLFDRVRTGNPHAVLTIGLFVLTLVPLARVAFCFFLFIRERDYTYVAFTAYVLAGLIVGVLVGSIG